MGETAEMLELMETWTWTFEGRLLPHELPGLRHAMRDSWRKRREIWLKGGRGSWAEGDERKVMYEDPQQEDLCALARLQLDGSNGIEDTTGGLR